MYQGYKYIDADAHILEPQTLWDDFLDPRFKDEKPYTYCGYRNNPLAFEMQLHYKGQGMPWTIEGASTAVQGLNESYDEFIAKNFSPECYTAVFEKTGCDYMVVYPSVGLYATTFPTLSPATAAAYRRAYNDWLYDFCQRADRRVLGAGSVDLRDPQAAALEARRCVKDLGFKAVHINPTPVAGRHLYDRELDVLWNELEDLDVPLGIHVGAGNLSDSVITNVFPGLKSAGGISAFTIGNMFASIALVAGGVLERHPRLRVVHLESGAGWVAFWMDRMQAGVAGGFREQGLGTPLKPWEYFLRQCFISADPDDPGIKMVIDNVGVECVVTGTDFGHPEGRAYSKAIPQTLALAGVTDAHKRKIMWDNSARLYNLA